MRLDPGEGIERRHRGGEAVHLAPADAVRAMRHLTLQVGQLDDVVIDQAERADAGGGEIQRQRTAKPAGADHQHTRLAQTRLAGAADLGEQDVARVALDLVFAELHAAEDGDRSGRKEDALPPVCHERPVSNDRGRCRRSAAG